MQSFVSSKLEYLYLPESTTTQSISIYYETMHVNVLPSAHGNQVLSPPPSKQEFRSELCFLSPFPLELRRRPIWS